MLYHALNIVSGRLRIEIVGFLGLGPSARQDYW
jgi:hypothetical protein